MGFSIESDLVEACKKAPGAELTEEGYCKTDFGEMGASNSMNVVSLSVDREDLRDELSDQMDRAIIKNPIVVNARNIDRIWHDDDNRFLVAEGDDVSIKLHTEPRYL